MPEYDNFMKWWGFLKPLIVGNISWAILIGFFLYSIFFPEKVQLLASFFHRFFANISSRMSKKSIENELQSRVLENSKKICKDIDEVLPYKIKINWVKTTSKKPFSMIIELLFVWIIIELKTKTSCTLLTIILNMGFYQL